MIGKKSKNHKVDTQNFQQFFIQSCMTIKQVKFAVDKIVIMHTFTFALYYTS